MAELRPEEIETGRKRRKVRTIILGDISQRQKIFTADYFAKIGTKVEDYMRPEFDMEKHVKPELEFLESKGFIRHNGCEYEIVDKKRCLDEFYRYLSKYHAEEPRARNWLHEKMPSYMKFHQKMPFIGRFFGGDYMREARAAYALGEIEKVLEMLFLEPEVEKVSCEYKYMGDHVLMELYDSRTVKINMQNIDGK